MNYPNPSFLDGLLVGVVGAVIGVMIGLRIMGVWL